ncbi:MAG TPA: hypothetical protein VKV25_04395, partial [Acidimicrobiales bacterium]|nr:hypothetical protein [Acidimicrobiales bacterium]
MADDDTIGPEGTERPGDQGALGHDAGPAGGHGHPWHGGAWTPPPPAGHWGPGGWHQGDAGAGWDQPGPGGWGQQHPGWGHQHAGWGDPQSAGGPWAAPAHGAWTPTSPSRPRRTARAAVGTVAALALIGGGVAVGYSVAPAGASARTATGSSGGSTFNPSGSGSSQFPGYGSN